MCVDRQRDARLEAAAGHRRAEVRGRHRARRVQRHPLRPGRGWLPLLLLQPAAAADRGARGPGRCGKHATGRLVRGVLLSAQPDAIPARRSPTRSPPWTERASTSTSSHRERLTPVAGGGDVSLEVSTSYPWTDEVGLTDHALPRRAVDAHDARPGMVPGGHADAGRCGIVAQAGPGMLAVTRGWAAGDRLVLRLEMAPRITFAAPPDRRHPPGRRARAGAAGVRGRGRRPAGRDVRRVARGRSHHGGPSRHRAGAAHRRGDAARLRGPGP